MQDLTLASVPIAIAHKLGRTRPTTRRGPHQTSKCPPAHHRAMSRGKDHRITQFLGGVPWREIITTGDVVMQDLTLASNSSDAVISSDWR